MKPILAASITIVAIFMFAAAAHGRSSDPFQGNWKIQATPERGDKPFDDTISFQGGKFTSKEMTKRGFQPCAYDEDTRGRSAVTFTAQAKSDKAGEMKWSGTITATEIRGDIELTKPDGTSVHYTYTGERAAK